VLGGQTAARNDERHVAGGKGDRDARAHRGTLAGSQRDDFGRDEIGARVTRMRIDRRVRALRPPNTRRVRAGP
jgi:hypothetical protein